jgi:hypothetical protein
MRRSQKPDIGVTHLFGGPGDKFALFAVFFPTEKKSHIHVLYCAWTIAGEDML